MSSSARTDVALREREIDGPAAIVAELLTDVALWPQFIPSVVHTERDADGRLTVWSLAGEDRVRKWQIRQTVTVGGNATDGEPTPEPGAVTVEWRIASLAAERTRVEMRVVRTGPGAADEETDPAEAQEGLDVLFGSLDEATRARAELPRLVLSFEDPLFVAGRAEDAYQMLYEADKWPERIEHVRRLEMIEPEPGIQFFDMETTTPDGAAHTTRSVRVCLPHRLIVYKQIKLPVLLDAHTGHWRFSPTEEGLIVAARHTVTVKPSALEVLGPGTTVADARRYLRRVLSANSMKNLYLAKTYAEERAGG